MFMLSAVEMAERHGRILARLSELGLAQAERLHDRAMAAEDPKTAADLGLTFHRVSRGIRQSIALEAKLVRDAARAEREATAATAAVQPRMSAVRIAQRKAAVQKAVEQIFFNEREPDEAEWFAELLEDQLTIDALSDDFGLEPLDVHIARICADFDIAVPEPDAKADSGDLASGAAPPDTG